MVKQPGRLSLRFQPADGSPELDIEVFKFKGPGVAMGMYNTDEVGFYRYIRFLFTLYFIELLFKVDNSVCSQLLPICHYEKVSTLFVN